MTDEEKEAIEDLKQIVRDKDKYIKNHDWVGIAIFDNISTILNLIQKQQREIEKLKKHNKDLLRKLRNRVKEVKKLIKYSSYKKEFATLNKQLKKKDKTISEMAIFISNLDVDEDFAKNQKEKYCKEMQEVPIDICEKCIINYFKKIEEEI